MCGALEEVGVRNFILYGDCADSSTLAKLRHYILGIAGATKHRGMIYGEGGGGLWNYTAHIDPSVWDKPIRHDVDNFDQVDVIRREEKYPKAEAEMFLGWMRKEFGGIEVKDEVMLAQIRMYFAFRDAIKEKSYDFIAVKCVPVLPSCYRTSSVAHALLNDAADDGFGGRSSYVAACMADANGALTMQILNNISGGTTMFTMCCTTIMRRTSCIYATAALGRRISPFSQGRNLGHRGLAGVQLVLGGQSRDGSAKSPLLL